MNRFGLLLFSLAACAVMPAAVSARDRVAIDFRSGASGMPLKPYGPDAEARIKPDGRGLRRRREYFCQGSQVRTRC